MRKFHHCSQSVNVFTTFLRKFQSVDIFHWFEIFLTIKNILSLSRNLFYTQTLLYALFQPRNNFCSNFSLRIQPKTKFITFHLLYTTLNVIYKIIYIHTYVYMLSRPPPPSNTNTLTQNKDNFMRCAQYMVTQRCIVIQKYHYHAQSSKNIITNFNIFAK